MLLVVFDDYKLHMRRLGVVNALTSSITRANQQGPMMATALEELKGLMSAKAAWFRLLEGDQMVISDQIGLSQEFLRDRLSVPKDDDFERTLSASAPVVVLTSAAAESVRPYLKQERFHHVVLVAVLGKKSVIGTLALGSRHHLSYTPDELEFLTTTAHQLGLAVENLRLVEQILRSHRQWTNTFDSIHDLVLLHDADFRVMKANHALLERLGRAPADVVGQLCEACCRAPRPNGRDVPTASDRKTASTKDRIPASADTRWSLPPPTWSREASRRAPSTWCATPPTAVSRKKNTACCSSRCRKAFSWPRLTASCSIAMTPSSACWATPAAKS